MHFLYGLAFVSAAQHGTNKFPGTQLLRMGKEKGRRSGFRSEPVFHKENFNGDLTGKVHFMNPESISPQICPNLLDRRATIPQNKKKRRM